MKRLVVVLMIGIMLLSITACGSEDSKRDVKNDFEKSVFIGDSITEGFSFNEILPKESVMAGAGATAGYIYEEYIDDLTGKKPDNIFIMLGSDDMLMPVDDPKEFFINDLTKLINKIKEDLPDSKIYIQSITPVTEEALAQEPRYEGIEEYNDSLKELATNLAVNYVDIGELVKENPSLYAEDGIHFKKEFYQLWLQSISKIM